MIFSTATIHLPSASTALHRLNYDVHFQPWRLPRALSTRPKPLCGYTSDMKAYLLLYNLICAAGWAFVVFKGVTGLLSGTAPQDLYEEIRNVL
eukprot:11477787-Prorocentrum_lima.AAC.1